MCLIAITKQVKVAAQLMFKTAAPWHPVLFLPHQVTEFVVKFVVIRVG